MTTNNLTPPPTGSLLTTGQIVSVERRSNMTDDEALRFARAIEFALLSKLRAPVAEEAQPVATLHVYKEKGKWAAHVTDLKDTLLDLGSNPAYAAPPASTTRLAPSDAELYACFSADLGPGGKWVLDGARLVLDRYRLAAPQASATIKQSLNVAPQASETVRILFPTHLRKMWSGGEVQAWLDAHQNVTAPKPSAKGSFGRYRHWQQQQSDLKEETVRRSQEKSNER